MPNSTVLRTNIFGITTSGSKVNPPAFSTAETLAAGKLIDKLKWIADDAIANIAPTIDWLGSAANQGQNGTQNSMINKELVGPTRFDTSNIFKGWTAPAMPTLPAFPTLPTDLKVDAAALKTSVAGTVDDLEKEWIARFLPSITDITALDRMPKEVLDGTTANQMVTKLDTLETALKQALATTAASVKNMLSTAITTSQANLTAIIAGTQPKIDAATAVATNNTANIAWARARDQSAREAARLESESVAEWAARGFALPGGSLAAQAAIQRQATLDSASKIAGDEAVRAQGMYLDIAKLSVTSWVQAAELQVNSEITAFKTIYDANANFAQMEMEANRAGAKQAFDHLGLRINFTKDSAEIATRYRTACADSMNGMVNAYANISRTETEYLKAIADAQRANLMALIEYYRVSLAESEMGMKVSLANNENDIRFAQIAAQFIAGSVTHHVEAAQQTANVYAKIAAMALSGMNGIASVGNTSSSTGT